MSNTNSSSSIPNSDSDSKNKKNLARMRAVEERLEEKVMKKREELEELEQQFARFNSHLTS